MLTIYGSIAAPSNCQTYVAASLDIPYERVRIVAPCVGEALVPSCLWAMWFRRC